MVFTFSKRDSEKCVQLVPKIILQSFIFVFIFVTTMLMTKSCWWKNHKGDNLKMMVTFYLWAIGHQHHVRDVDDEFSMLVQLLILMTRRVIDISGMSSTHFKCTNWWFLWIKFETNSYSVKISTAKKLDLMAENSRLENSSQKCKSNLAGLVFIMHGRPPVRTVNVRAT